ncbi:uncharacterized protein LOC123552362 [Mercenaria mercenaria]|uniref:uncharacterized protein LOC123552362 n=1 Tax=Mercenaria mercenaria TaxID=6596 RepID=UPI00234ED934|nr:uncharacterized protein LOC123552362 [Mercenaria mercenaria]XP_045197909.2 uncharacterized protein LOC123552362 [Mercenaria mercenaria]XP_045197910.2 uncharacterized protein LOC123552362 [Mercenaria mercenaria]
MDDYEDYSPEDFGDEVDIIDTDDGGQDVVMEEAPDGGMRAWLIVLSCFGINLIVQTMTSLIDIGIMDENVTKELDLEKAEILKASNYFKSLSDLYAPFAVLVMINFGYKVTVVVGSLICCFSFTNMSMLGGGSEKSIGGYWQFWLCGPAAIGINFLKLGALVPVLEYFTAKRMKALVLSRLGLSLGAFGTMGLIFATHIKWRTVFRINAGLCILSVAIAFTLRNIGRTKITKNESKSKAKGKNKIFQRIKGIFDIPLFKNRTFWIVMGVFFVFKFGLTPPALTLPTVPMKLSSAESISPSESIGGIAAANAGGLGGMGSAYLFKRLKWLKRFSKKSLMFVLTMVAVSGPIIGIFSVITPENSGFYIFFNLVVTIFQALSENMRDESIPSVFGRPDIRITESFLNMFVGVAGMISGAIQHGVDAADKKDGWKVNLRLGGSFLLMVGVVTAVLIILHKLGKFKLKEKAGARQTRKSTNKNENEPSDDQLPEDIEDISMTEGSGKMQNIDDYKDVQQRNVPMRHVRSAGSLADASHQDGNVPHDERMQQVYGMPPKTRHLSVGNFTAEANNQMHPDTRMSRSYSASENAYEQHHVHAFNQNMQGHYPFQGRSQYVAGHNQFQGNNQVIHGHYPFQGNMQGHYPFQGNMPGYQFQGNDHNMQGPPVQERGKGKRGRDSKHGKSQNYPFNGKRQPIPSNDPNRSKVKTDNYVEEQITDEGTVLY